MTGRLRSFLVVLAGALVFFGCKESKAQKDVSQPLIAECAASLTVEMGKHVFLIPRDSGFIFTDEGKVGGECVEKTVKSDGIIYRPVIFLGKRGRKENNFVVSFTINSRENIQLSDTYSSMGVREKLKRANIVLEDLPTEGEFYRFEFSANQYFYIAIDKELTTPLGNPVTFMCSPWAFDRSLLNCGTFMPWMDNIEVGIGSIQTDIYPISEWRNVYYEVPQFVESLSIRK